MRYFFSLGSVFITLTILSGCTNQAQSESLSVQEMLDQAYMDEMKAEHTYEQVIEQFGEVRPFSNIIDAEVRHSQSVLELYQEFELKPPIFEATDAPRFNSIQDACTLGVTAEQENIALYEELMSQTKDQRILSVFENLQRASEENHLPAFERCSEGKGPALSVVGDQTK